MKNLLVLLFLSCCGLIYSQEVNLVDKKTITYTRQTCENGTEKAKSDFDNGEYNCYSYGLVVLLDPDFSSFLEDYRKSEYGIIAKNAGCRISTYSKCYSAEMRRLVYQKFGSDIFDRSRNEAKSIYQSIQSDSLILTGIKRIPESVFQQTKLTYLSVVGQDCDIKPMECFAISEISKDIGNLRNLEVLRLTLNYITKLPAEVLELKELRVLDLTDNPHFSDLEMVKKMKWLEEFYCFGCNLTDIEVNLLKNALPNCKIEAE